MSASNPHFKHVGRAAYELPALLLRLGDPDGLSPLTDEQAQTADAIEAHADNAANLILSGLEAIGTVMSTAARSEEGIAARGVEDLANLITHLAVEMQHLRDVESNMRALRRLAEIAESNVLPRAAHITTPRKGTAT